MRWRNYGLWVSFFSLIGLLFRDYVPINYPEVTNLILGILVAAGIISNPKEGSGYSDD